VTLIRIAVLAVMVLDCPAVACAHYHMLLPDKPAAKTGETVTLVYQFGHPFEHQLFETQIPKHLSVIAPDGTRTDLLGKLEKIAVDGADGKKVTAFKTTFTPEKRGDYTVVAVADPVTVEGEKVPLHDVVKVVVHVQTQNGWDRRNTLTGVDLPDPSPLTRPYGLQPGIAFRAEFEEPASGGTRPLVGALVEVERYNPTPPKELPPDEHITRTARTDRVGTATATFTDPGWWCVTCIRDKSGVRQRGTIWVHVDEAFRPGPGK
jgi:uncharacterized GH25 family protein